MSPECDNKCPSQRDVGLSLVVQWLRLCVSTSGGAGSIPDWRGRSGMPQGVANKEGGHSPKHTEEKVV